MGAADQKPLGSGFGAKSSADEVMAGVSLAGKSAIVTGGYSGIGLETTRALALAGARVLVPARDTAKAKAALAAIEGDIAVALMDLGDLKSVARFADAARADLKALDLLIANAGIMACPETRLGPGWEAQFATNHIGHFALAMALAPLLAKGRDARVVSLSSSGHKVTDIRWDDPHFTREPYNKWRAYGQSKTANALFALGFDARWKDEGVRAFAVHPGGIFTPLLRHLGPEEVVALGWTTDASGAPSAEAMKLFKTPSEGAATTLWCATSPMLTGRGGLYCEDCDVAELAGENEPRHRTVKPYAVSEEGAERLWGMTEAMLTAA